MKSSFTVVFFISILSVQISASSLMLFPERRVEFRLKLPFESRGLLKDISSELIQVKQLMAEGRFEEALEILEALLNDETLNPKDTAWVQESILICSLKLGSHVSSTHSAVSQGPDTTVLLDSSPVALMKTPVPEKGSAGAVSTPPPAKEVEEIAEEIIVSSAGNNSAFTALNLQRNSSIMELITLIQNNEKIRDMVALDLIQEMTDRTNPEWNQIPENLTQTAAVLVKNQGIPEGLNTDLLNALLTCYLQKHYQEGTGIPHYIPGDTKHPPGGVLVALAHVNYITLSVYLETTQQTNKVREVTRVLQFTNSRVFGSRNSVSLLHTSADPTQPNVRNHYHILRSSGKAEKIYILPTIPLLLPDNFEQNIKAMPEVEGDALGREDIKKHNLTHPRQNPYSELDIITFNHRKELQEVTDYVAAYLKNLIRSSDSIAATTPKGSLLDIEYDSRNEPRILPENVSVDSLRYYFNKDISSTIPIEYYLKNLAKFCRVSKSSFLGALILIKRIGIEVTNFNVHRLFLTALQIASKMIELRNINNKYFSIYGGLSKEENDQDLTSTQKLNKLEAIFVMLIHFDTLITPGELSQYWQACDAWLEARAKAKDDLRNSRPPKSTKP